MDLLPGDTISLPTHMFRGFENLGSKHESGFLFAVLGGNDPGKVVWSPPVFDLAAQHGLVLLEGGRLIDTVAGEVVPESARRQHPPTAATLKHLASPSDAQMENCVVRTQSLRANPNSPLSGDGVAECPIIGPVASLDGFGPGPITGWWPHGFSLRCLKLESGAAIPMHCRSEAEVIFVHSGALEISTSQEHVLLAAGDIFTTPIGMMHALRATSSDGCIAYVVRGAEGPAAPVFA